MDYSNTYAQVGQQHVQGSYDPSLPSQQPYDPSSSALATATAASQSASSSGSYYYDPQQYAAYYQDYANYYYEQNPQQPPETHQVQHSQNPQFYQEPYLPPQQDAYYAQASQNPSSDPLTSGVPAQTTIHYPMGQFESSRGRGRGRRGGRMSRGIGRLGKRVAQQGPPRAQITSTIPPKPPRMEWCEVCRVECNTPEILEQHRNGKRHQKNLRAQQELQNVKAQMAEPEKTTENNLPAETKQNDENAQTAGGVKRKKKKGAGKGGKLVKTDSGGRQPVGLSQVKEPAVPFICELCNVKCDTQLVFSTHLAGKKHLSNMKKLGINQPHHGQARMAAPPGSSSGIPISTAPVSLEVNSHGVDPVALLSSINGGVPSQDPQIVLAQLIMNYVRSQQTQGLPHPPPQGQALMPGLSSAVLSHEGQLINHGSESTLTQASALPPATAMESGVSAETSLVGAVSSEPDSRIETAGGQGAK